MDCQTARQSLAAIRPGTADSALPEFASAREHVQSCAACQTTLNRHDELDLRIGELCRDVAVPAGLKDRILDSLQSTAKQPAPAATSRLPSGSPAPAPVSVEHRKNTPLSRRKWSRRIAAAACALLVGVGAWFLIQQSFATVSLDEIDAAGESLVDVAPEKLPEFVGFASGVELHPPQEMNLTNVRVSTPPRHMTVGERGIESAVFFLTVTSRGSKTLTGRLAVLPLAKVAAAPPAGGRLFRYVGTDYAAVWTEGNLVYVCYLSGRDAKAELEWRLPPLQAS